MQHSLTTVPGRMTTPGEVLNNRYRVVRAVAKGGMGAVLEGVDERLQRVVAIKIVRPELVRDPTLRARFEREARAAAAISHPNVLQVFDLDVTTAGQPFLVMEWMVGESLATRLRSSGKFEPTKAAIYAEQALRGLAAAHQLGIVHRDIKPGNLMLVDDGAGAEMVKVVDFGIAQLKTGAEFTRLTMTGEIIGTPAFMPPEQLLGREITQRTDIYSVGVTLWCLLVGKQPFGSGADVIPRVLAGPVPRADAVDPSVPGVIADIVERSMQRDPAARFGSAVEMADALADARRGSHPARISLAAARPAPSFATNTLASAPSTSVSTVPAMRPNASTTPSTTTGAAPRYSLSPGLAPAPMAAAPPMFAPGPPAPSRAMKPYAIGAIVALAAILLGVGGAMTHRYVRRPSEPHAAVAQPRLPVAAVAPVAPVAGPSVSPSLPVDPAAGPKPPEAVPNAHAPVADAGVAPSTECENWSGSIQDFGGRSAIRVRLCTRGLAVSGTTTGAGRYPFVMTLAGSWNAAHTVLTYRDGRIVRAVSTPCLSTWRLRAAGPRRLTGTWSSTLCRGIDNGDVQLSR